MQRGASLLAPILPDKLMHLGLPELTFRRPDHIVQSNFERSATVLRFSLACANEERHEQYDNGPKLPSHRHFSYWIDAAINRIVPSVNEGVETGVNYTQKHCSGILTVMAMFRQFAGLLPCRRSALRRCAGKSERLEQHYGNGIRGWSF
jgi:hypothetical protein